MRLRHLCGRDTFMYHWKSWLCFRWVCKNIKIREHLWNMFCADQANNSRLCVGFLGLKTQLPGEWLHVIWESGKIVCIEPIGRVEILKDGVALGDLYSQTSYRGGWECPKQEVEGGRELWVTAERTSHKQWTLFNLNEEHPQENQISHRKSSWASIVDEKLFTLFFKFL